MLWESKMPAQSIGFVGSFNIITAAGKPPTNYTTESCLTEKAAKEAVKKELDYVKKVWPGLELDGEITLIRTIVTTDVEMITEAELTKTSDGDSKCQ